MIMPIDAAIAAEVAFLFTRVVRERIISTERSDKPVQFGRNDTLRDISVQFAGSATRRMSAVDPRPGRLSPERAGQRSGVIVRIIYSDARLSF